MFPTSGSNEMKQKNSVIARTSNFRNFTTILYLEQLANDDCRSENEKTVKLMSFSRFQMSPRKRRHPKKMK